jgi:hypothetical protein
MNARLPWLLRSCLLGTIACAGLAFDRVAAQTPLKYGGEVGQDFGYNIQITVEAPDRKLTYKGLARYKVKAVKHGNLELYFEGGLNESTAYKAQAGARGPGRLGPRMIGPPPFRHPFGNQTLAGVGHSMNWITLSPLGHVVTMKGNSQLPWALGNVSLLVFEDLPDAPQNAWRVDVGVTIGEKKEEGRGHLPHIPFSQPDPEKRSAGTDVSSFKIAREEGDLVTIEKTYQLQSPNTDPPFEMTGGGTWVFNRKTARTESLEYTYKLVTKRPNATVTYPITVQAKPVAAEDLAKIDEAKRKALEDLQRKEAEKKSKAEAPIAGAEREQLLATLRGSSPAELEGALAAVSGKAPRDDQEVAAAIEPLLKHADVAVREKAQAALARVSPTYKHKADLNKVYRGDWMLDKANLGEPVKDSTPLPSGLIVAMKDHMTWYAVKVLRVVDDNQVEVQYQGRGSRREKCPRANLRLAPPEVDQADVDASAPAPARPAAARTARSDFRTWKDTSGQFSVEAKYLGLDAGRVRLVGKDGRERKIPLEKLSAEDQQVVKELQQAPVAKDPFEVQ